MIIKKSVQRWLFIGVILILIQIMLGGITRLTDSGLSITEWKVIQGTLPPMNEAEWNESFSLYKVAAKKQFSDLNSSMNLSQYKWIFFWEYFHRLWARMMGFAFLIPFLYFYFRKMLPSWLIKKLFVVIGLASLAAVFGIIMVFSGLNDDQRTWVSAYKLTTHLLIATSLLGYLFYTWKLSLFENPIMLKSKFLNLVFGLVVLQLFFGGLMAGMRAALIHPYFSIFSHFDTFRFMLSSSDISQVGNYESNSSLKALIQILHRSTAFLIISVSLFGLFKFYFKKLNLKNVRLFISLLIIQIFLGILTISFSIGHVPVFLGVLHQLTGLLTFVSVINLYFE